MKDYSKYVSNIDKDTFILNYKIKDYNIIIKYANKTKQKLRLTKDIKIKLNNIMLDNFYKLDKNIIKILNNNLKIEKHYLLLYLIIFILSLTCNIILTKIMLIISSLLTINTLKNIYNIHILKQDINKNIIYFNIEELDKNKILDENKEINKNLKISNKTKKIINKKIIDKDSIIDINSIDNMSLKDLKKILIFLKQKIIFENFHTNDSVLEAEEIIKIYKKHI